MFVLMQPLHRMSRNSCICCHQRSWSQPHHQDRILRTYWYSNDDLPSPLPFDSELDLCQHKWTSEPQTASELDIPEKALLHTDGDFFPNIRALFHIMATLPVTTCECEQSISMLRLTKSPFRSIMRQNRLNGLVVVPSQCSANC